VARGATEHVYRVGRIDFEIALTNLKYNAFMPAIRMLDIQSTAFDETDDGLEPAWLLLSPEERLRQHQIIIECGLKLEEAIKGVQIPRTIDRSVRYDILRDAF
jgi:hypothetical protein